MDAGLEEKLLLVTENDNERADEAVLKEIIKIVLKAKEPALNEISRWLAHRLADEQCGPGAKIKVLRLIMATIGNPKAKKFVLALLDVAMPTIEATKAFTCPPDPTHGEKPAELVRTLATKCCDSLRAQAGDVARPAGTTPSPLPAQGQRAAPSSPSPSSPTPASPPPPAPPTGPAAKVLKDFNSAIQIDVGSGGGCMELTLGASMQEEVERNQRKLYTYKVEPRDGVIDFGFTVKANDMHIGLYFTATGADLSYPLEGWAPRRYDTKDGTKRGSFECAGGVER